jgi:peptidoglycan/xylan/chitin deacetylase (PgdA/CDA1 family)
MVSKGQPIFYYHSVAEKRLSVKPSVFRAQLSYLKHRGYHCIGVGEWLASQKNGRKSEKCVALTFDDGFGSMWENVLPLLQEFGFRATFFIVPGYVGKTHWGNPNTGTWSGKEQPGRMPFPMMTWNQITRLGEAGMEIGSHTLSHPNLTNISEEEARKEIRDSKEFLEEKLGISIQGFCYPLGRQNEVLTELVQKSGYRYGCTTKPGYATPDSNPFLLPRIPGPASMSDFIFHARGFPQNVFTQSVLRVARKFESLAPTMYVRTLRTLTRNRE